MPSPARAGPAHVAATVLRRAAGAVVSPVDRRGSASPARSSRRRGCGLLWPSGRPCAHADPDEQLPPSGRAVCRRQDRARPGAGAGVGPRPQGPRCRGSPAAQRRGGPARSRAVPPCPACARGAAQVSVIAGRRRMLAPPTRDDAAGRPLGDPQPLNYSQSRAIPGHEQRIRHAPTIARRGDGFRGEASGNAPTWADWIGSSRCDARRKRIRRANLQQQAVRR